MRMSSQCASSDFLRDSDRQGSPTRCSGSISLSVGSCGPPYSRSFTARAPPGRCGSVFKRTYTYSSLPFPGPQTQQTNKNSPTSSGDAANAPGGASGVRVLCSSALPVSVAIILNVGVITRASLRPSQPRLELQGVKAVQSGRDSLSNLVAPFQTWWLMKSTATTSMKCRKMGHSLNYQVHPK